MVSELGQVKYEKGGSRIAPLDHNYFTRFGISSSLGLVNPAFQVAVG